VGGKKKTEKSREKVGKNHPNKNVVGDSRARRIPKGRVGEGKILDRGEKGFWGGVDAGNRLRAMARASTKRKST